MSGTTTLWRLQKKGHSIICIASGEPGHEEMRVLVDDEVYFTEIHSVHEGLIARAGVLQRGYEARGWTQSAGSGPHEPLV